MMREPLDVVSLLVLAWQIGTVTGPAQIRFLRWLGVRL